MKRWSILLGRCGTTLVAIGLALFLVSLIPSPSLGGFGGNDYISGQTWQTRYGNVMTPQQILSVTITTNGTLDIYVLEVDSLTVYNWISERSGMAGFSDVANFDQFLESNPTSIAWQGQIHDGTISHEYVPTKVVNVTLAIANHSPDVASSDYEGSLSRSLAPVSKVQTISEITVPVGIVLTLPWLSNLLKVRRREKASG